MVFKHTATQENLYANIKAIAADKRIMMKELAAAAGIADKTLWNYFNGVSDMPVSVAFFIADKLGYKLSTLLTLKAK